MNAPIFLEPACHLAGDRLTVGLCEALESTDAPLILITSSAEVDILGQPEMADLVTLLRSLAVERDVRFVSLGCVGLFSCIQCFQAHPARSALVLLIEAPAAFAQRKLDEPGLGRGGDGLLAIEGAAAVVLRKDAPSDNALQVSRCRVLAKNVGLAETVRFAEKIERELDGARALGAIVSFWNASPWSARLSQVLDHVRAGRPAYDWLASCELDHHHRLTVKPLADLTLHGGVARDRPLTLTCLGSGGRFGLLTLGPRQALLPHATAEAPIALSAIDRVPMRLSAAAAGEYEPMVLHAQRRFFGLADQWFEWRLEP